MNVVVTGPTGTSSQTVPFTYVNAPAPIVSTLTPNSGPVAGGTTTITGSGFTGTTQVRFGSLTSAFTVNSDNQVSATAPAGSGTVPVTVTTPGGTSTGNAPYSYLPAPAITSLHPSEGMPSGGDSVTITGTGFTHATDVRFGTSPGLFSIVSDTQIVARAPAGAGTVIVTVTSPGGFSSPGAPYVYL